MSASKFEAMVLSWRRVQCLLQVRDELLPKLEEFKHLSICNNVNTVPVYCGEVNPDRESVDL